ncbi:tetratricopeptide repeat protein [Emticicia sp. SJ17W-69]|uniref:tetratricopeptide repeat protein n=1 Tax=Emticicia sp. SJ17W-69 TaxID=3421657 RepID=UPI003EB8C0C3
MQKLFFWQNWLKTERFNFLFFLTFLIISIIILGIYWVRGLENVLHWDILSELDEIPTVLDTFSDGKLKFTVNGNAYIIKERFLASGMSINVLANYMFLGFFILGLNLLLAAFSSMSRYWFLGGMIVLAGVLITFHLENIFNITNQVAFLGAFGVFAGLAFYFNTFAPQINFLKRLLFFAFLTIVIIVLVAVFTKIQQPAVAVASYGLLSAIILTATFILFISHEILAGLVWVVSNSGVKNRNHLPQFLFISSIYLLNVLLIYLEKAQYIDWNILPISPIFLFVVSLILGIWGFRDYCEQANFVNFRTIGSWFYVGFAIISTGTIAYAYGTANDPLIEAIEDFISYAHLAIGLTFFFYVLVNFIQPLQKGLTIHKIIYKPKFIELMLFRLAAIVLVFILISIKNYNNYFQTKAGYYNAIGDFYVAETDVQAAETFYKEALHFDIRNHKSNYALASLAMNANDKENIGIFLKNALEKNPSPFAYIGLSKVLQEKDMFFDALFTIREGVNKFPKNQQLLTNLAFLYEKTKVTDSTLHYLTLAKTNCTQCDLAESNLLAYHLKYGGSGLEEVKKLTLKNEKTDYESLRANRAAVDKQLRRHASTNIELSKDSALNVSQFALLYNLASFNNYQFPYTSAELQKIQRKEVNNSFYEDLEFAVSARNFFKENKIDGLKQLSILANDSTKHKALYNQVAGMWFLQQGVYDKAITYLSRAGDLSSVAILQQQDYHKTIIDFQEAQASELLANTKTKADFDKVLAENPLNPIILSKTLDFYNTNLKKPNDAYNIIFKAIELNDNSVELWKLYTLQSLKIGMADYAEDGILKLKQLATPADYQAFLSTYQAQKALMEKNKQGFN